MKMSAKAFKELYTKWYYMPNNNRVLIGYRKELDDIGRIALYDMDSRESDIVEFGVFYNNYGWLPEFETKPHYTLQAHDLPAIVIRYTEYNHEECETIKPMFRSKFTNGTSIVFVSDSMTGKMSGIPSISTNCLLNSFCIARRKNGESVCAHCFAAATIAHYSGVEDRTTDNYYTLTEHQIPTDLMPHFKSDVKAVRFESFGDLQNETHYENFLIIAACNPHAVCTLWTKNTWLTDRYIKPENMVLIQSSVKLNTPEKPANEHINHVFTVYSPDFVKENEIKITCGARDCSSCRRCYVTSGKMFNEINIAEELK